MQTPAERVWIPRERACHKGIGKRLLSPLMHLGLEKRRLTTARRQGLHESLPLKYFVSSQLANQQRARESQEGLSS